MHRAPPPGARLRGGQDNGAGNVSEMPDVFWFAGAVCVWLGVEVRCCWWWVFGVVKRIDVVLIFGRFGVRDQVVRCYGP